MTAPPTPLTPADLRAVEELGAPDPACPKHMVFGPCGGVRADGACELGDRPCPFVDRPLRRWDGPLAGAGHPAPAPAVGPEVIVDLRVRPYDLGSIREVTGVLAPISDALLVGEHHSRPDFPPSFLAAAVIDSGGRPWVTLTCRDRNRVVLEGELEALAAVGVAGVHCVTGDARAPSVRTDASQVFDLDSLRLAALANAAGLRVSVAASPVSPPVSARALRVLDKERAGAHRCFVNHAGGVDGVRRFVAEARALGVTLGFVPCVPVITDERSWRVLAGFPGLLLDESIGRRVLGAADRRRAGVELAVEQARAMAAVPGVVGVDLSGSATAGDELDGARIMAEIAGELRRGW